MTIYLLGTSVFIFSLVCYFILLKFSTNLGVRRNHEGQIRFSAEQKPALGGVVFYVAFILSVMFYAVYSPYVDNTKLLIIVLAVSLAFLIGLADDAFNTIPILKFLGQFSCAIILIAGGYYIKIFDYQWLNYALTVFWVIGLMNSINMLDNMDGTAAVSGLCIAIMVFLVGWLHGMSLHLMSYVNVGVIAVLLAFLFFNWHPSKMYMGDSGSMLLGLVLAILGIQLLWNPKDVYGEAYLMKRALIAISIFIVPLSDTVSVVINRMKSGSSPFVGGKDHTTHHLNYWGVPIGIVPLVLMVLSIAGGLLALSILQVEFWSNWNMIINTVLVFFLFFLIYSFTFSKKK